MDRLADGRHGHRTAVATRQPRGVERDAAARRQEREHGSHAQRPVRRQTARAGVGGQARARSATQPRGARRAARGADEVQSLKQTIQGFNSGGDRARRDPRERPRRGSPPPQRCTGRCARHTADRLGRCAEGRDRVLCATSRGAPAHRSSITARRLSTWMHARCRPHAAPPRCRR